MTADTTFKEFVEEAGFNFCLLAFDSSEYRELVKVFNRAKLKLEAEADDREYKELRANLMLPPRSEERAGGSDLSRSRR